MFSLSSPYLGSNCGRKTWSQIEGFKPDEYKDKIKKKYSSPKYRILRTTFWRWYFPKLLEKNATMDEGMDVVAQYYKAEKHWEGIKRSKGMQTTWAENYFQLLMIVKTMSAFDNVWVSFTEGLHCHTAILFCLTCSDFDFIDNEIIPATLTMKHLKNAEISYFKKLTENLLTIWKTF